MAIKFRYLKSVDNYVIEYNNGNPDQWQRLRQDHCSSALQRLGRALAGQTEETRRRWDDPQWYYSDTKVVFFTKEYLAMAFMGACVSLFGEQTLEFSTETK